MTFVCTRFTFKTTQGTQLWTQANANGCLYQVPCSSAGCFCSGHCLTEVRTINWRSHQVKSVAFLCGSVFNRTSDSVFSWSWPHSTFVTGAEFEDLCSFNWISGLLFCSPSGNWISEFSSRWHLCARDCPYALRSILQWISGLHFCPPSSNSTAK